MYDVIVIGAGAAGMMCAAVAGRRGRRVLLIEHYDKLGEKIRISGGGRCNFTNLLAGPGNYLSQNPDFCRSALARYTPRDFITLVTAPGGLTVPKIGATPFGYRIAEQFGLKVVPPRPALVPLAFDPAALARYGDLSGIAVEATVSCNGGCFRENLLFTHRGLSGPAILQVSSYWKGGDMLHVDLLPGLDAGAWLASERHATAGVASLLAQRLPHRFAQQWSL